MYVWLMKRLLTFLFAASCLTALGQVPEYLVSSNPVMYFDFDGNAIESVNEDEPLLSSGDIAYVESAERHVLELNGSGAHLYHPDATFPSFETVSMCMEVRLDEFGSGFSENLVPILSKWESTGAQNNEWNVFETDGRIWLWWKESANPGGAISFIHNWTPGEWHTICFEVGSRAALWVDGEFVEEKNRDEFGSSDRLFRIGDWNNFQNPGYQTLNGAFNRLAIWSGLLSNNTSEAFHLGEAAVAGCTNPEACNFDELANQEDGSCVACDIATAFCGEGTTWDPVSQTCIVAFPSDSNFDGCVQLNDLLDLLGAYGVCEAEESIWQCGDPMEYQGHDYATVNVGEQCWFAENLRAESYRNGDAIATLVGAQDPFASGDCDLFYSGEGLVGLYGQTWACFTDCSASFEACGDSVETLLTFGLVYNEHAVSDSRGLCPAGWHASTDEEWMILEVAMGMTVEEAQSTGGRGQIAPLLKSYDFWCEDNSGEGNEGLQLRPAGTIQDDCGASSGAGSEGYFWTPSETGQDYFRRLQAGSDDIDRFPGTQTSMLSVRCIQDEE